MIELEILPGRIEGPLAFESIFGRKAPLEIEIGVGKGRFILEEAAKRPATDFLGLEWSLKHLRLAKERASTRGLTNVRFHHADAKHVLADLLPDSVAERVHVYCPDPWPKKRHHKRRLLKPEFVHELALRLAPQGYLHAATDWETYAQEMLETLTAEPLLANTADGFAPRPSYRPLTKFEARGLALGHRVWDVRFRRR